MVEKVFEHVSTKLYHSSHCVAWLGAILRGENWVDKQRGGVGIGRQTNKPRKIVRRPFPQKPQFDMPKTKLEMSLFPRNISSKGGRKKFHVHPQTPMLWSIIRLLI